MKWKTWVEFENRMLIRAANKNTFRIENWPLSMKDSDEFGYIWEYFRCNLFPLSSIGFEFAMKQRFMIACYRG